MEEENKNIESQASLDNEVRQVPYFPAAESCGDLGSVVPKNLAKEQKNFNSILKANYDVSKWVMSKLGYKDINVFCSAFAKEQIDAIATAIFNFERNGFGLIVSDQTGLGKGRVVAGLIRYTIHSLNKVPVFFTEKDTLFSDIYRDLIDIKYDVGVPVEIKKTKEVDGEELEEDEIIKMIQSDIDKYGELSVTYDFEDDFELDNLFEEENEELLAEIIQLYRDEISTNGITDEDSYEKVNSIQVREKITEAIKQGRSVIRPFSFNKNNTVLDKEGNVLYRTTDKEMKSVIATGELPQDVKLFLCTYSQVPHLVKGDKWTDKGKLIQSICNNTVMILDESHNAAGKSKTYEIMSLFLRNAKDVVYVSATWAKTPKNMPIYAIRTSIKESFLSSEQLESAFTNGGLALQEVVSASLVNTGQLVRRERTFKGETEYYYASPDSTNEIERQVGLNQINKIDRMAAVYDAFVSFENSVRDTFKLMKDRYYDKEDPEQQAEAKDIKFSGGFSKHRFLLFNYFLLGIKVRQTAKEAVEQLKSGRKVVIALANTLESKLNNLKKDYVNDIPYELGDVIENDLVNIMRLIAYESVQYSGKKEVVNNRGEKVLETINYFPYEFTEEEKNNYDEPIYALGNDWFNAIQVDIEDLVSSLETSIGIPLSPLDQIRAIVEEAGFTTEEITGRKKVLKFNKDVNGAFDFSQGVYAKRETLGSKREIINKFNFNEIDCLIINQSGSTGVSMHAVPTTDKSGKLVAPVNVVPSNPPISLFPKNEVKQRCMIIMQMELDINKEVQKLGRVERSGQIFPPIYKYIFSAVPSEARLAAMMQKKLKSLMANTKGGAEQGADIFNFDDLFNNAATPVWNAACDEFRLGRDFRVKSGQDIYNRTKLFYFLDYTLQKNFFDYLTRQLKEHIAKLKEAGLYLGEVEFKQYEAKTLDIIPFIIGDNNALSEFGGHTYAERVEVIEYEDKNTEREVAIDIANNLHYNLEGETIVFSPKQKKEYIDGLTKIANETADSYIEEKQAEIEQDESSIAYYEKEIADLQNESKSIPSLDKALELSVQIDELENRKEELDNIITGLVKQANDNAFLESQKYSREQQQVAASIQKLQESLRSLLSTYESVSELRYRYRQIESQQKNNLDSIEKRKRAIERNREAIAKEKQLKDFYLNMLNSIGSIFDFTIYKEDVMISDDSIDGESEETYVYTEAVKEQRVLTRVNFSFTSNYHFTPAAIELTFMNVTSTSKISYHDLFPIFNDEEQSMGKKSMYEITSTDTYFENAWNSYVSQINTGVKQEKVFLSGNMLRGLAFRSYLGVAGNITKYNTFDNKLRTSMVLDKTPSESILPRFNEGVNYELLMDLTKDNIEATLLKGFVKAFSHNRGNRSLTTQVVLDLRKTYLVIQASNELKNTLLEMEIGAFVNENGEFTEEHINKAVEFVKANKDQLVFSFVSETPKLASYFESIVVNFGATNLSYENMIDYRVDSMTYGITLIGQEKKGRGKKKKEIMWISEPVVADEPIISFKKNSFAYLDNLIIVNSSDKYEYLQGLRNNDAEPLVRPYATISFSYDLMMRLITHLESMNTRMLVGATSEMVRNAVPAYVFDFTSSQIGTITDNEIPSVEGVAENTIEGIEDVLREFVEFYQS